MYSLRELADLVGGSVAGDPQIVITGVSEIQSGTTGTITFLANPKYKQFLSGTHASAIIVQTQDILGDKSGIIVDNPQLAFARILEKFSTEQDWEPGIHPTAIVDNTATIGIDVSIGPYCVIGKEAVIGDASKIGSHCVVGESVIIGKESILYSHVTIYRDCRIGCNAIINSGTTIGSDGFGFVQSGSDHVKIPQNGNVVIGDQVEIGSNCSIDRGTIGSTTIDDCTKMDNLVHIAHNVQIGKGCLITGQVGIAGSSVIGDFCIFAGQAGVAPHVTIGNRAVFAAKTGVTKSVPGGKVYAGMPAREIRDAHRRDAIYSQVQHLKKRLEKIEAHLNFVGSNDT